MSLFRTVKNRIKKPVYAVMRVCPPFRKLVRKTLWAIKGAYYGRIAKNTPVQDKHVVFCSFRGRSYACSPRALFELMVEDERFKDWQFTWCFRPSVLEQHRFLEEEHPNVKVVGYLREGFYEALASAKYWITNSVSCEWVWPKPEQVYVQTWHGTPLKRLGCDIVENTTNAMNTTEEMTERYRRESSKWDYLVSPSTFTTESLTTAFDLDREWVKGHVLQIGYPRNDAIVNTCADAAGLRALKERLSEEMGFPLDKKLLLYAPTWRDSEYKVGVGYVQDVMIDFELMQRELGDEWVVLFRPHYFIANSFDFSQYGSFVVNAAKTADINELYCIADALMTDYSSVFFDYACTKRPFVFYMPDLEEYATRLHGFYLDPEADLPGPLCKTSEEAVQSLKEIDSYFDTYGEQYRAFQERFCPQEDGRAAARMAEAVFAG